jgi:exonuclease III
MKILTWNCNQGISDDFSAIKDFDADVVIIQECEKSDKLNILSCNQIV